MSVPAAASSSSAATAAATAPAAVAVRPTPGRIVRERIMHTALAAMFVDPNNRNISEIQNSLFDCIGLSQPEVDLYKAIVAAEVTGPYKVPANFRALMQGEALFSQYTELFSESARKMMQHMAQLGDRKAAVLKMTADAVVAFVNSIFSGVPYRSAEVEAVVASEAAPLEGNTGPLTERQGLHLRVIHARNFSSFEHLFETLEGINPIIADTFVEKHSRDEADAAAQRAQQAALAAPTSAVGSAPAAAAASASSK